MVFMNEVVVELGKELSDATHVAVALGPGGFSAVRVGVSAALGIVTPSRLPVVGIPTHQIEALDHVESDRRLFSTIPAGRGEISWALHNGELDGSEYGVSSPAELIALAGEASYFCGEGVSLFGTDIPKDHLLGDPTKPRQSRSLLSLAIKRIEEKSFTPYEELRPIYARAPSISKPKPRS
jgi:tRNA threonylcarbamoyl adenosine modification protein YeaZ